ncbi:hypothetical protein [Krasilnikovia sp. MM14-A1259]|uniref:hypothetical protein n=1 Tax=Krasilnikovia sp. MM14-A1259 TaxID=3373539 RepID=UPI0038141B71
MPRVLELGLNRIFRSRWGVALVIAALVLAVVGIGRLFSDGDDHAGAVISAASPAPALSADPKDDDSVISPDPPPSPTSDPGTAEPEAVAYAFASAWVNHQNVSAGAWHDALAPNATKDLSDELAGVNPADVPADRVLGRPTVVPVGDGLVNAVVTTNAGKLTLRLVAPDRHWLVDGIDWDSA